MQVSLRSKPLFNRLSYPSSNQLRHSVRYLLKHKTPRKMGLWLSGSMGATLMLGWDPKLVGATFIGMGLMGVVYWGQTAQWQRRWRSIYEFCQSFQGKLAIAVISGGLGTIGSYMAFYIWCHAQNRWLATGLILQGLGTFLTLGLLSWQLWDKPRKKQDNQYQEWVSQLTDNNELKRLIAVENLARLLEEQRLNPSQIKQLSVYFLLMLKQENNTMIRQAILKGCQFSKQM